MNIRETGLYSEKPNILDVRGLKTYFYTEMGVVKAVDGVDFTVKKGEILGLVGESGCGKSVSSFSIMRLISPPGKIVEGQVLFHGDDLLKFTEKEMTHIRGNRISMIFQQPQSSLNPVFKIGDQMAEVLQIHHLVARGRIGNEQLSFCARWVSQMPIVKPVHIRTSCPAGRRSV